MKKIIAVVPVVVLAVLGQQSAAWAVPGHLHCMTNASGKTHAIAVGVTLHAPHEPALHNFHENVHLGAFAGNNPQTIVPDLTEPFGC
jgi:hypothetical protein